MSEVVVGREPEFALAADFLQELGRDPGALLIQGEAGIGKSTLWLQVIHDAEERGYRVLEARPAESEAKLSYAALTDLIGPVFDETRGALPAPQERGLAAALLRDEADGPTNVRTVGAAVVSVLHTLADKARLLVAIDDVQWIDASSARVLSFAVRRLPAGLGLLLARRTEGEAETPIGFVGALPEDRIQQLSLGPLSLASLHHLIRDRLGSSLPRPLLTRLDAASGGNPFFALEIARALDPDPDDRALGAPLPVPRSLRELVATRLGNLSGPAQEAVLVAAALFRPNIADVTAAMERPTETEASLIEAEEAAVIVSERGRIRFTHPLLASAVYGSAPEGQRRRLHRRLAEVVADLEERARHLAQSTIDADAWTAMEIEEGARRAALRGAQDAAAELFDAAARLTPGDRPDDQARRLLGQAAALNAVGDFAAAHGRAERALDSSRAPSLRAAAHSFLGTLAWFDGDARVATRHLEQALEAAADDHELRGEIYAKLVRFNFTIDFDRAMTYADEAMSVLRAEQEPVFLAHVLIDRFFGDALLGRPPRRELLRRGLELEEDALPTRTEPPHPIPLIWFLCMDEFDAARTRFAVEEEWYRDRGEEVWLANRQAHLALIELRAGRWELAERYVEESCTALNDVQVQGPMALVFEKRALVDAHRGRVDRARTTLLPMIEEFEGMDQRYWAALALSTLAFTEFAAGDHMAAVQALSRMRQHTDSLGVKDNVHDRSEPYHIESRLALGQIDRARDVLRDLEVRSRVLPRLWTLATLPRARALVLAAEGDVAGALLALEDVDRAVAPMLPFEHAWTLLVKGRLLRRAKQKRAAADTLLRSMDAFERLGAPVWVDQARRESERVGLRRTAPSGLTESERRVAELVACGFKNREVAAQLFISPKTVEANLDRVYRKLGIHSRAELGAELARGTDRLSRS
jgi:DNA-binding CsgD family transcriptional regulator